MRLPRKLALAPRSGTAAVPDGWPVAVSPRVSLAESVRGVEPCGVNPPEAKKRIAISINNLFMSFVSLVLTSNESAARGRAKNSTFERFPAFIHHQFPSARVPIGQIQPIRRLVGTHYLEAQCVADDDAFRNDAELGGAGVQLTRHLIAGLPEYHRQERSSKICLPSS